jgi:hypothetical protein
MQLLLCTQKGPLLLLQVPKVLSKLSIQALQQHSGSAAQQLVDKSLHLLLDICADQSVAVLGARLYNAVLQQLQQAGLLQHLSALMTLAAQELTAASSAQDTTDTCSSGSSSSMCGTGDSRRSSSSAATDRDYTVQDEILNRFRVLKRTFASLKRADQVLFIYSSLSHLMNPAGGAASSASLEPAPAALQLIVKVYDTLPQLQQQLQTYMQVPLHGQVQVQQQQQQQQSQVQPTALYSTADGISFQHRQLHLEIVIAERQCVCAANMLWFRIQYAICRLMKQQDQSAVQPTPPVDSTLEELLCSPQLHRCMTLVTCVAVMSIVSNDGSSSTSSSIGGRSSSGRSSSGRSSSGSSQRGRLQGRQRQQQPAAASGPAAGCAGVQGAAAAPPQDTSSSAQAAGGGFNLPVSPLSSRLFELLGVELATVQLAASRMQASRLMGLDTDGIVKLYEILLESRVSGKHRAGSLIFGLGAGSWNSSECSCAVSVCAMSSVQAFVQEPAFCCSA